MQILIAAKYLDCVLRHYWQGQQTYDDEQ